MHPAGTLVSTITAQPQAERGVVSGLRLGATGGVPSGSFPAGRSRRFQTETSGRLDAVDLANVVSPSYLSFVGARTAGLIKEVPPVPRAAFENVSSSKSHAWIGIGQFDPCRKQRPHLRPDGLGFLTQLLGSREEDVVDRFHSRNQRGLGIG
jgi:hypothetical protein